MQKSYLSMLALATVLGFSSNAFAGDYNWGASGYAEGGAGGFAGTAVDGWKSKAWSKQDADVITRVDTDPNYAAAVAGLEQSTGGYAMGYEISGQLYMEGGTNTYAQVGRRGTGADTYTEGTGGMYGAVVAGHGTVKGTLSGESDQYSMSIDTPYGGGSDSEAQQLTEGSVKGSAYGRDAAATEVGVSVTSVAEAN